MYNENNIPQDENQLEILLDKKENGKFRPWKDKKIRNEFLEKSYERIGYKKRAQKAEECATRLDFKVLENGKMKLQNARFCQLRLCPMCGWRRELKIFSQLSKVVKEVEKRGFRFILLTLTCKNVSGDDLIPTEDILFKSFKRLFKLKQVKQVAIGYFRALEITHDIQRKITKKMYIEREDYYTNNFLKVGDWNPNFNKYHPHFHVMICVNKSYFKDKAYLKHADWVNFWQQSLRADYTPIVDVRAVKNDDNKGISEVAKYTVKDTDYIVEQDLSLTDDVVKVLDAGLAYRRLIAYGGNMKQIHKELNFSDDISADINIEDDNEVEEIEIPIVMKHFEWHVGYKNYILRKIDD